MDLPLSFGTTTLGDPATATAGFTCLGLSEAERVRMDLRGDQQVPGVESRAPTASVGVNVGLFPFIAWIQHSLSHLGTSGPLPFP